MLCRRRGYGASRIIGDQVLFCNDVVAIVALVSFDGVERTETAPYNWCRPLCIT
jgi:hypothetical protein